MIEDEKGTVTHGASKTTTTLKTPMPKGKKEDRGEVTLEMPGDAANDDEREKENDDETEESENEQEDKVDDEHTRTPNARMTQRLLNSLPPTPNRGTAFTNAARPVVVPSNLPHFRGNAGIEDPLEWIEQFARIVTAHGIEQESYLQLVPICLELVDV
jgi:hypothetical protein